MLTSQLTPFINIVYPAVICSNRPHMALYACIVQSCYYYCEFMMAKTIIHHSYCVIRDMIITF